MQDLEAQMSNESNACLSLGLPAEVSHIIDHNSPLFDLSVATMAARKMEACIPSLCPCRRASYPMHGLHPSHDSVRA